MRPATADPSLARTAIPAAAERSIGWLNVIVTSCDGLANWVLSSGVTFATDGATVVKVETKSSRSTPSAAELSPFAIRRL